MKRKLFYSIFALWLVLWFFFLVREDKDGQYKALAYLYQHGYNDKVRYLMGPELYDFLVFCKKHMPNDSTYQLVGFKRFSGDLRMGPEKMSISEVRARYFMWPLRNAGKGAEFKIVHEEEFNDPLYKEYKSFNEKDRLFIKI